LTDPQQVVDHIVNHFKNIFSTNIDLQVDSIVDECIPNMINENTNAKLTLIPSHDEIQSAVFALNKDGAPGPDGFGAFFFQTYLGYCENRCVKCSLRIFHRWLDYAKF
jgi:hypothetical protein